MKGKFIVIEGCDCTGKSSVIEHLVKNLKLLGIKAISTKALGDTDYGKKLRQKLMEEKGLLSTDSQIDIAIDAMQDINVRKIKTSLEDGITIICDRYYYSTLVYQGYLNNEIELVEEKLIWANLIEPDITFILDCKTDELLRRKSERTDTNSFDPKNRKEFDKVRQGYLSLTHRANTQMIKTDGLTISDIGEKIMEMISIL